MIRPLSGEGNFLDMNLEETRFDASTIAENKARLLAVDVARRFFADVVRPARAAPLLSAGHFTVDGTLSNFPSLVSK